MKSHIRSKALLLVVVMAFHAFVLVPCSHAVGVQNVIGRVILRAIAPSVINTMVAGSGAIVGIAIGTGVGYLILKSGAIGVLKSWWDLNMAYSQYTPTGAETGDVWYDLTGANWYGYVSCTTQWNGSKYRATATGSFGSSGSGNTLGTLYTAYSYNTVNDARKAGFDLWKATGDASGWNGHSWLHWGNESAQSSYPTVPGDYGTQLDAIPPAFTDGTIYGTPGALAGLAGGAAIVSAQTGISDADLDKFIAGSQATAIDADASTQEGIAPNVDNTLSTDTNATIPLFQQMINYLSNLLGIKDKVSEMKTSMDNVATGINAQSTRLDNIATLTQAQTNTLDNVLTGINAQTTALESVETKVEHLDNTISVVTSTSGTVQSRIDSLKTLASTKFPFSIAGSLSVSAVSGASTYDFDPLPLTPTISIPISPMTGPLASTFTWFRQMIVWFFWVGTLFAILKKAMEM